jgi:hypothetical protein
VELARPAEAFELNPFVFVPDFDGRDIAAGFVQPAEQDGRVGYFDGFEDWRVLGQVSEVDALGASVNE